MLNEVEEVLRLNERKKKNGKIEGKNIEKCRVIEMFDTPILSMNANNVRFIEFKQQTKSQK